MPDNFRQEIDAFIAQNLSPAARSKALADFAVQERNALIQSGQASRNYTTTVDGRIDPNEYHVKGTGGGIINYHFSFIGDALEFCILFLKKRIYSFTGDLANSLWISVDGQFYPPPQGSFNYGSVPPKAQVVIGNTLAYWRKADTNYVGTKRMRYHAPNILADCVSAVRREFGASAISAKRVADWNFPGKSKPVGGKKPFIYQSPVIVLQNAS
jgi:hypothetical protein